MSRDTNFKEKLPKEMAMKIPHHPNPRIGRAYLRPTPVAQRKTFISRSRKLTKDEVILSPRATEMQRLKRLANDVPDVRQEKIDAIKKQIKAGTYDVFARSVVESIIDLHIEINREDTS